MRAFCPRVSIAIVRGTANRIQASAKRSAGLTLELEYVQ